MKWTLKKVGSKYVVKFHGEDPLEFITKNRALAYINDRVLSSLSF
jgi:dsDNA-binding SOS-regulon protein